MLHIIPARRAGIARGFTLIELMVAMAIAALAITAAISSYVTLWTWWYETSPEIEAQRIARIAIATVIYGTADSTAGTYTIGTTTYRRHNGIAQATRAPALPSPQAINFGLEPDSSNVRSYYLGTDPVSGLNAVYYRNSSGTATKVNATVGISDLNFTNVIDGVTTTNMVTVTAVVDWDVAGTGAAGHHIHIAYSQLVYLKNVS